jgi:hypothetical protein
MTSACAPDPIAPAGSQHAVNLHNTGFDRYLKVGMVVGVVAPSATCGIELSHQAQRGVLLPNIPLGSLPSGAAVIKRIGVSRTPDGTTMNETIRTTVRFASDFENDPLNDEPDTPYICMTKVDVGL